MSATSGMKLTELYGGAMQCSLPEGWRDSSEMSEIPDNQEVWVHVETDTSVVIELVGLVADEPNEKAAEFHFKELADANKAGSCVIRTPQTPLSASARPHFGEDVYGAEVHGTQQVAKFRERAENTVQVSMGLLRLANVETDLLITVNKPLVIDAASSSANAGKLKINANADEGEEPTSESDPAGPEAAISSAASAFASSSITEEVSDQVLPPLDDTIIDILHSILSTIKVNDWDLFGDGVVED